MDHLHPERMLRFVISSEEVNQRLERRLLRRRQHPFHELYESIGILDFGELDGVQVLALVAARNFMMTMDLLDIPQRKGPRPEDAKEDLNLPQTSIGPSFRQFLCDVPSSDYDFDVLTDPEQVPMAVPEDLMLRRRAPREFLRKMTEGELMRYSWLEHEQELLDDTEEEQEQETPSVLEADSGEEKRGVFGHLLLDASESMGWERDTRNIAGRGLALAFHFAQMEAGNPIHLHLFRSHLEEEMSADESRGHAQVAAAILTHDHSGMTGLQSTLEELVPRLQERAERVDIVLITDGLTRLTKNPLNGVHLHTFLLGDQSLDREKGNLEQVKDAEEKLFQWSDYFFELSPGLMAEACVPLRQDVLLMEHVLENFEADVRGAATAAFVRQVHQRALNLRTLVRAYREAHPGADAEIDALHKRATSLCNHIAVSDPVALAMENTAEWNQADRDAAIGLEDREVRSVLKGGAQVGLGGSPSGSQTAISFWEALWLLLRKLARRRQPS